MTPETLKAARASASVCAESISLPLHSRVWKGMAGDFSGAGSGSSLDFQDHRNYAPGDDPRHINWQAYARTGDYTMKLFREEVRPMVDIVLDVSDSMFFDESKSVRVAEIFYTIINSSHKAGAALSIHLIKGSAHRPIPIETIFTDQWFSIAESMKDDSPNQSPSIDKVPFRANTIRVFISDLLFLGDPAPLIRHCTQRQGSLIILAPFSQAEANPEWSGNYEFVDAESGDSSPHRIEPSVLKSYKETYNNHFTLWHNATMRHQSPLARIPADKELMQAFQVDAIKSGALEIVA